MGTSHDDRGRDCMVVGFTTTFVSVQSVPITCTTKVVNLNPAHRKVYLMQHYMIKFVSDNDMRQISGFLWVLWIPPPIKLSAKI